MTNTVQEKLDEILIDLSPDKQEEFYNELHDFMCKSIIVLLKDSIAGPGISQQQIDSARGVAEKMPDTEAAKELLEFLDNDEVQEALVRDA
jgi:predicted O-methyltransferase YrrM